MLRKVSFSARLGKVLGFNSLAIPYLKTSTACVVVQPISCVRLFETPWTAARQASLSFAVSQSLLKLMSTESVMPSNHLILCHPLLLLPSIFPSTKVFSNESVLCIHQHSLQGDQKYWILYCLSQFNRMEMEEEFGTRPGLLQLLLCSDING